MKISGEYHHIKPKSLFPTLINDKSNIVKLTYREHYVCHHLLFKIYEEKGDINASCKMAHAWFRTCKNIDGLHINSYLFEKARFKNSEVQIGKSIPEEIRKRMSESHKNLHWWTDGRNHKHSKECPR